MALLRVQPKIGACKVLHGRDRRWGIWQKLHQEESSMQAGLGCVSVNSLSNTWLC